MYGRDDDEAILYYHVNTHRKCKTTFKGVVLPRQLQYLYPFTFKRPPLDGVDLRVTEK